MAIIYYLATETFGTVALSLLSIDTREYDHLARLITPTQVDFPPMSHTGLHYMRLRKDGLNHTNKLING